MRRWRASLGAKLLIAQLLVVVAGAATLLLVAGTLGPWLFDRHLRRRVGTLPDTLLHHVHMAFQDALGTALLAAVAAATLTAVLAAVLLTRRIVAPIRSLADGAAAIATGRYDTRVPVSGEDELTGLAVAFNQMAASLQDTERTRAAMIADVAHELRTPLATLDGYLEALTDGVLTPDATTIGTMRDQTRRMARLAADLALVSQAEEHRLRVELKPTDLSEVISAVGRAFAPELDRTGVSLQMDIDHAPARVRADSERLQQVLGILLDNALRHTTPGGRVTISAVGKATHAEIRVIDSGEGIPADQLERIFTRFHRIDPSRGGGHTGSGIGLTVARAIIQAHHGTITATSDGPGLGAQFQVRLPFGGDITA